MEKELKDAIDAVSDNTKKDVASQLKGLQDSFEAKITEATKDKVSEDVIKGLKDQFTEEVNKVAAELEKFKDAGIEQLAKEFKGFDYYVEKGLKENEKAINEISKTGTGVVKFKAAEIITTANFGTGVIRGFREAGVNTYPDARRFIFNMIQTMNGGPGSDPLSWINRVPKEGGSAFTAEGGTKPILDWTYTEGKATAEYIAVTTPVSRKALVNMPMLRQEINDELLRDLYNTLDRVILRTGTGISPSVNSIWGYAKTFDSGGLAGTIPDANIFDVLRVAVGQVRNGDTTNVKAGGFSPSGIIISEDKATSLDLQKDKNGQYLFPMWAANGDSSLKGVPIIASKFLADDEFVTGEMLRYLFNIVDGIEVAVGLINDQFVKNEMMIRAELMGAGRVKLHDTFAFVKGSFDTALAALSLSSVQNP